MPNSMRIHNGTLERLKVLKIHHGESHEDLINRLLDLAIASGLVEKMEYAHEPRKTKKNKVLK